MEGRRCGPGRRWFALVASVGPLRWVTDRRGRASVAPTRPRKPFAANAAEQSRERRIDAGGAAPPRRRVAALTAARNRAAAAAALPRLHRRPTEIGRSRSAFAACGTGGCNRASTKPSGEAVRGGSSGGPSASNPMAASNLAISCIASPSSIPMSPRRASGQVNTDGAVCVRACASTVRASARLSALPGSRTAAGTRASATARNVTVAALGVISTRP